MLHSLSETFFNSWFFNTGILDIVVAYLDIVLDSVATILCTMYGTS